jgi:hypothetical protein
MKQFIFAFLVIAAMNSILLDAIRRDKTCNKKPIKHNSSHSASKSSSHNQQKKCACQFEQIKKDLNILETKKCAFLKQNEEDKQALLKKLAHLKQTCAQKKKHSIKNTLVKLIGEQKEERRLGGSKRRHPEEEECSQSESTSVKPAPKKKNVRASHWANNVLQKQKVSAKTAGVAYGHGGATSHAGPCGAESQAKGSHGTKTGSNFRSDNLLAQNSWGAASNGKGAASNWGSKALTTQKVDAKVAAASFGEGNSGTKGGNDGAAAYANGSKGSKTNANWDGDSNHAQNSFGTQSAEDCENDDESSKSDEEH